MALQAGKIEKIGKMKWNEVQMKQPQVNKEGGSKKEQKKKKKKKERKRKE
jgi:hypothetical protein